MPYVVATTPDTEMLLLFLTFITAVPRCASSGQVTNHQSAVSGARAATERGAWVKLLRGARGTLARDKRVLSHSLQRSNTGSNKKKRLPRFLISFYS